MKLVSFHHPDISMPVLRRRATEELLQLLMELGDALATRGRSLTWNRSFPSQQAYWSAVSRLRRSGLVVSRQGAANIPILTLSDTGRSRMPDGVRPEKFWNRKWNGYWYILFYDVPEQERGYRDVLRRFLARLRMGCLQRSVWVSPDDIRPQYDDLRQAAAAEEFSFLFESKTVLGRPTRDIVHAAWPFDRLEKAQSWYCKVCSENVTRIRTGRVGQDLLMTLAREEMSAYLAAMKDDPLLPRSLWPKHYNGHKAHQLHRKLMREIAQRL